MPPEGEDTQAEAAAPDAIKNLEERLAAAVSMPGISPVMRAIDPATITALVNLFLGLFDACRTRFGAAKAMSAAKNPGAREKRIAQRLVLRDHFDGDRRAYRDGGGDELAVTVLRTASRIPGEQLEAAAMQYREDTEVLNSVSEEIDGI